MSITDYTFRSQKLSQDLIKQLRSAGFGETNLADLLKASSNKQTKKALVVKGFQSVINIKLQPVHSYTN